MLGRKLPLLILCATPLLACSKDDAKADDAKPEDAKADDAKPDDAKPEDAEAAGGEVANAAGGEVANPDAVVDCPKSLAGKDTADRVITKACGVVPVTADYSIEGATLTLEAGATLAFAEGAKLSVGYYEPAKLVVKGTAEAPVTLTTSADQVAGVWEGVHLYGKANRSSLQGLVIEYAGNASAALTIEAQDVTLTSSTVRHAKGPAIAIDKDGAATISATTLASVGPVAMQLTPRAAGGVAADNTFPAGALVHVHAGKLQTNAQWAALGTPWLLTGRVQVHGESGKRATLTLAPGAELQFDGDGGIDVGYYDQAALVVEGTASQPIRFLGHERQEAGGWGGLRIYGKGEARFDHVTFTHGGKQADEGVLLVEGEARVTLKNTTFEDDAVGVVVRGKDAKLEGMNALTFQGTPVALQGAARYLGMLGTGNTYVGEPRIVAEADKLEQDATWTLQPGAKVELDGRLQVTGMRLGLEPGVTLHVKDGVEVQVGYYDVASLELRGTADQPITFQGQRDEPGTWDGLVFFPKAKGNVLEHVVLRNAGGQAGARFDGESDAKIKALRCDKCSAPTLTWTCKSSVEHDAVEAGEGTTRALAAPACK